ncbi:phosphotransferase [Sorangium sp. So ce131]|uniref:phosphotransferase n=1 Tax=Sorangium sp. So ce131 TaxID=3133282 RepID=UPI003F618ECB
MSAPAPDLAALLPLLPEDRVGAVERLEPITLGLSGASVYAVTTSRGAYVLRVQGRQNDEGYFAQQLRVLRRAADAGVAPAVVHVDEAARAVVSARVLGAPVGAALVDPALRGPVLASVVDRLRALHAIDPLDVAERDPLPYARAAWEAGRSRPGFPPWAASLAPTLEAIAATLAGDPRLVVSHNDLNPVNILWDGARAWLVDWEVTGLGHPYYDLAVLALFLRLDDDVALDLVARHDGAPLDERSRASFRALRRLAGLVCGLTILSLVDDLSVRPAPTWADAPSLASCYEAMRAGHLDPQSPRGRATMGLALLAQGVAGKEG